MVQQNDRVQLTGTVISVTGSACCIKLDGAPPGVTNTVTINTAIPKVIGPGGHKEPEKPAAAAPEPEVSHASETHVEPEAVGAETE